jgi:hypothetical protein
MPSHLSDIDIAAFTPEYFVVGECGCRPELKSTPVQDCPAVVSQPR